MKKLKTILFSLIIFILATGTFSAWCQQTKPPEDSDRIKRAKAKLEKARRKMKSKNTSTTPGNVRYRSYYPRYYRRRSYPRTPPKPGKFDLRSIPVGAEVYLNGKLLGVTPITIKKPAGTYPLKLKLQGYGEINIGVIVPSGSKKTVTVPLEKM